MRIAIFTDTFYPNVDGVSIAIANCVEILARKGHEILIVAPDYGLSKEMNLAKNVTVQRIFSVSMPTYRSFRFVFPLYGKCLQSVRSFKPDIIHIETYSTLGYLGARIAKKLGLPLVGTYHTLASEFVKYLSPLNLFGINGLIENIIPHKMSQTLPPKKDGFMKRTIWRTTIRLYNKCNLVVTPSPSIKGELESRGLKKPILPISNGIKVEIFANKRKFPKKPRKILYVGRVSYEKRVDLVIFAFSHVIKSVPDAHLTIIGQGPALGSIKILSEKLGLSKNVSFIAFMKQEMLGGYYRQSDIFMTASPMETQGLVLIEARSCGLPCIGVDRFAVPDVIHHGINGYVARQNYAQEMAQYAVRLLCSSGLYAKASKAARQEALKHNLKKCVEKLEKVYLGLAPIKH